MGLILLLSGTAIAQPKPRPKINPALLKRAQARKIPTLNRALAKSLFPAVLSRRIEPHIPAIPQIMSHQSARVRVVMDNAGAVIKSTLELTSGDPAYDASVMATLRRFSPTQKERLPVPKDARILAQVTGPGVVVHLRRAGQVHVHPAGSAALLNSRFKTKTLAPAPTPKGE